MKYWLTLILFFLMALASFGQSASKVIIQTDNCNQLIGGIKNYISILTLENDQLTAKQISAYLFTASQYEEETKPIKLTIEKKYGKYEIRPDTIGVVEFHVLINGQIEKKTVKVKPLQAVCRLSRYKANTESKISLAEFNVQEGIIASIECCGFDAKCKMIEFEIMRIGIDGTVLRAINKGGRFEKKNLTLIHQAKSGDIYIFRNLYYQCASTEKQRSEDMIIEIK